MSASHITGLADIVRQTRGILADLPAVADKMKTTATAVMANVATVTSLTAELESANVELVTAIGAMSNGGPPLETTTGSAAVIPAPSPVEPQPYDDTGEVKRFKLANGE